MFNFFRNIIFNVRSRNPIRSTNLITSTTSRRRRIYPFRPFSRRKVFGVGLTLGTFTGLFVSTDGKPVLVPQEDASIKLRKSHDFSDKELEIDEPLPPLPEQCANITPAFIYPARPYLGDEFMTVDEWEEKCMNEKQEKMDALWKQETFPDEKSFEMYNRMKEKAAQCALDTPSCHPSFPSDRRLLDAYLHYIHDEYWNSYPKILPPRTPPPYGRLLTLFIDVTIFLDSHGKRREQTDPFLASLVNLYEIILYGDQSEDVADADPGGLWATWRLFPGLNTILPPLFFRHPSILNRPEDSFLLLTDRAEMALFSPRCALVLRRVDTIDNDNSDLVECAVMLQKLARHYLTHDQPIYYYTQAYQAIEHDAITVYRIRRGALDLEEASNNPARMYK